MSTQLPPSAGWVAGHVTIAPDAAPVRLLYAQRFCAGACLSRNRDREGADEWW
jgi:hypothetical protein